MFTRIGRFFKAIFNAVLGEAEGTIPVAMLEESTREMLDNLRSLREATATTIAFETKAKRELDAQNGRIKNLDRQAEEALKQGNEKLARRALQLQVEANGTRDRAEATYKAARLRADNSRTKLKVEEERVQGKIRQLGELKSIHAMNEAQRRMQDITDEYNIDGAMSVFDKTAGSIQEAADKLSAMDQIAVSEGDDLDRQLAAISQKTEVDTALDALKARLGEQAPESGGKAKAKEKISSAFDEKVKGGRGKGGATVRRRIVGALLSAWLLGTVAEAAKPSFEDLVANLKSPNAGTRQEAAAALGKSRRREAVTPLAALVRDPEPKVRLEVVKALRELRDPSGVPALVTSMSDGDPEVREEAIATLVEIYAERDRATPMARFLEIFSDEYDRSSVPPYTTVDPSVFAAFEKGLRDEESNVRRDAALALGILNATGSVNALTQALRDPDSSVRGAAATALGKVGTATDGKALVPLLADESAGVRNRVLQAIGVLRVREAGPALRELYEQNRRKELGLRVLACLSRIADPTQVDLFQELVQDPDPERRRLAVEALGRISDPSRLPAFKKDYQRENDDELKLSYSFALTLLGDRAFLDSIVLKLPSRTLGARSRSYILEMGRDILLELYPYLSDPDAEIRAALCDIIAILGDADAIPRLTPLLSDPSTTVADRANRAVERLKRRVAVPAAG